MRGLLRNHGIWALLACASGASLVIAAPAAAASYSPYNETPAAALARYVRALASDPKDFDALIGAGRSALELGDTQAAAGFFARADSVNPASPLPQAGMGAVQAAKGDANAALPYFARAQQLGASAAMIGCDRGLAYDLLGQQAKAQTDYRAALAGPDRDEARRRMALSLAIAGDRAGALNMLAPLSAKGDSAVGRVRAFVLALTGDSKDAMSAINAAMPGSWSRVQPFLQRLPTLAAGQKAAAVNLGIFPDSSTGTAYAYATPVRTTPSTVGFNTTVTSDRLSGVDDLLRQPSAAPQPDALPPQATQVAYSAPIRAITVHRAATTRPAEIWLQLASGRNRDAFEDQYRKLKQYHPTMLEGITGYLAQSSDRARLLIGPFRNSSEAQTFADDLRSDGINAFRWTNSPSDTIVPIATE